jgi:DNA-binding HxlR family transcriptional regulator
MDPMASGLDAAMAAVGDRWTLLVVDALLDGPRRFSEIEAGVPGLATNVLTARLRRLERDGLVVAIPYSRRPLRLEYQVTEPGRELAGALRLLASWGSRSAAGIGQGARGEEDATPRHAVCGSALETRWYCPTCDAVVERGEDEAHWV